MFKNYITAFLLLTGFMPATCSAQTSYNSTQVPVITSYNFQNAEGVDTQISSSDASREAGYLSGDMAYLGITHYRDADFFQNAYLDSKFEKVSCRSGSTVINHVTLLISSPNSVKTALLDASGEWPLTARLAEAEALNTSACPGMVEAIEGPNEINNFPVAYNGLGLGCVNFFWAGGPSSACSGQDELQAAETVQQQIYTFVHNTPAMAGVAADFFTGFGNNMANYGPAIPNAVNPSVASGYADYDNAHPYPQNGSPPYYWVSRTSPIYDYTNEDTSTNTSGAQPASTQPAVATEEGYDVGTSGLCAWNYDSPVTQDIAGKQQLMYFLDGATWQNLSKIFVYKLMDNDGSGFGLFDSSNNPTIAAADIKGMNSIIYDAGANAAGFTPYTASWSLSITPASAPIYAATLELANGNYFVAVWQEAQICQNPTDSTPGTQIAAPNVPVTLTSATGSKIWIYDPTVSAPTTPVAEINGKIANYTLTDHPIFFEVKN